MFAFGARGSTNNTDSGEAGAVCNIGWPPNGRKIAECPAQQRSREADVARLPEPGRSDSLWPGGRKGGHGLSVAANLQKKTAADIRGGCRGPVRPPELAG